MSPDAWGRAKFEHARTVATRSYVEARLHHFFGDPGAARDSYARVIQTEGTTLSPYGRAARIFIDRLDGKS